MHLYVRQEGEFLGVETIKIKTLRNKEEKGKTGVFILILIGKN